MGQSNFVAPQNVLRFPRTKETGKLVRHRESIGSQDHLRLIEGSLELAPKSTQHGHLVIPLGGPEKRAPLVGAFTQAETSSSSREYSAVVKTLRSPLVVSSSVAQLLVTTLILLALLPTLSVAAIIWLLLPDTISSSSLEALSNRRASPKTQATIALPAISMPTMVKAKAGEATPFPIAITGTDPVEGVGTIAISRLPQGSVFSAGIAHGETTWRLSAHEIENLHLVLPKTAPKEVTLMIQLLAPDGHVISDVATIVEVPDVPGATIPIRRVKTEVIPGHVWERKGRAPEATKAELVSQARAADPVPLPARRPRPYR
jgi:hypothetical protein